MSIDLKQNRILEIAVTADESDDTLVATAVTYRPNGPSGDTYSPKFTSGAAAASLVITLGEGIPAPTHIKLVSTFQA